jgi:class 3 adenylate cyclase
MSFSERTPPKEVVAYLDVFFGPLVTIVNQHGGIVNKFLGDGFMAVFGAPEFHCGKITRSGGAGLVCTGQGLTGGGGGSCSGGTG